LLFGIVRRVDPWRRDLERTGALTAPLPVRRWLLVAVLLLGVIAFAAVVDGHYPITQWLFFRYLRAAALAGVFSVACLVAGHGVLVRTLRRTLPFEEHLALAFPLGVLVFFLASSGFGLLGLYGPAFFVLCPCLLLGLGAPAVARTAARFRRHGGGLDWRVRPGLPAVAVLGFGLLGVLMIWFPLLTPENASYDARWYHLPIAENYVAQGGITRSGEGWVHSGLPQLASLLYAWAFSAPGSLFDRVEAAAHIEFAVFLATLVGVAALARRALGERAPLAFAAVFLFPGIFCYDSGLVLGADHVAALWAAPIFLLSLRYWQSPEPRVAVLLGAVIAGALDTKYTAAILLPFPLLVVGVRCARDLRSAGARSALSPAVAAGASVLAFTAPHWLKNAVYYGDPLYPLLRAWLPAHPWSAAAEAPYAKWFALRHPPFGVAGLVEMCRTLVTFSFSPHDFPQYHGDVPVFGSLFTLLTPALLLLGRRPRWRLRGLALSAYLGVAAWFWVHQFDRYLQTLVPLMAACVAALIVLLWREGGAVRAGLCALVGAQVVWGGDIYFFPTHRTAGATAARAVVDLLGRGFTRDYAARLTPYRQWQAIAGALPPGAKVLVHEEEVHLGLGAPSVLDYPGDQGALYWGEPGVSTPVGIWKSLRDHGVTHVLWASRLDHATDTVAGGLAFFEFAALHTRKVGTYGGYELAELPGDSPPESLPGDVAYYPCDDGEPFAPGLYPLEAMARDPADSRPIALPVAGIDMGEAVARARFLVLDPRCHPPLSAELRAPFELLGARGRAMMLVRRGTPNPPGATP
jgi:hypothetical protein